jgi:hypothetical protein
MPKSPPAPDPLARAFLTLHARVLACLAADPRARLRDLAPRLGVTERAVQVVLPDLAAGGYLTVGREGRRNWYTVHHDRPLPTPFGPGSTAADLVAFFRGGSLASG